MKATAEHPRGSVEKLSLKESVKGAPTVLRGSVRAPKGHIILVKCESFSSVVWTNCQLCPVLCGPLNLKQLPIDCDSLVQTVETP